MIELVVGEDFSALADGLASRLPSSPDPFVSELVLVPSMGVRRWLEQQIASTLGVSANIDYPFPGTFSRAVRVQAFGEAVDRWSISSLTGHVFALLSLPDVSEEYRIPTARGSLMVRARYVADLFDRYALHRADMVTQWAAGNDVDGAGRPLGPAHQWQPLVWRALTAQLGPSPAEDAVSWLSDLPTVQGLPPVVHAFGLSSFSADLLGLLVAMGNQRDVVIHARANSMVDAQRQLGADPTTLSAPANELLVAWNGAQHQAFAQLGITAMDHITVVPSDASRDSSTPTSTAQPSVPSTLLGAIQHQIRQDLRFVPGAQIDDTVSFHACSGEARQLEVLRDLLLGLLEDNPELNEGDIVVVCPRLDRFAHLIEPVFGPSAPHDHEPDPDALVPRLRYVVNHQPFEAAAPLFEGLLELLDLIGGRVPHSKLVSFLSLDAVRRRFDLLSDDRLGTAVSWLARSELRWGLDADHRTGHSPLPEDFRAHTLDASSLAILGGVFLPDRALLPAGGSALGVDLSDIDLAGQVGAFARGIVQAHQDFVDAPVAPMATWVDRIEHVAALLFATEETATWQWTHLNSVLSSLIDVIPGSARLNVTDVAEALRNEIAERAGYRSFGTGAVVFDGPQALRDVPHRVVVLLGFDSDVVPGVSHTADDLIAAAPRPGDRDRRVDARQMLLDAVLAAGERLIVTWDGHNIYTNAAIPPATVLQELLDAVATVADLHDDKDLVQRHPRFAHDPRHFDPEADTVQSFDQLAQQAAVTRLGERRPAGPLLPTERPAETSHRVSVTELLAALLAPTGVYARHELGLRFPPEGERPADLLPVELSGLARWQLGEDLLRAGLEQQDLDEWTERHMQTGALPPGSIGRAMADLLRTETASISNAMADAYGVHDAELLAAITPHVVPVSIRLSRGDDEVEITGSLPVTTAGWREMTFSRLKTSHELRAWFWALISARNDLDPTAVCGFSPLPQGLVFARDRSLRCTVDAEDVAAVDDALWHLVELAQRAQKGVVALFAETSLAMARNETQAHTKWSRQGPGFVSGDLHKPHVELFFDQVTFDELEQHELNPADEAAVLRGHVEATSEKAMFK